MARSPSASRWTTRPGRGPRRRRRAWVATCCNCTPAGRCVAISNWPRRPMPDDIVAILPELWTALGQTLLMLAIGLASAILLGGPLGIWLFLLGPGQSLENRTLQAVVGWLVNL